MACLSCNVSPGAGSDSSDAQIGTAGTVRQVVQYCDVGDRDILGRREEAARGGDHAVDVDPELRIGALIAGEDSVAKKLAARIWDPPNASYIGPRSFCTPNGQCLAYALREQLHGTAASMESELQRLKLRQADTMVAHQAVMVRAISSIDSGSFLNALTHLLDWHEHEARMEDNRRDTEFYICMPGLGLSRLAIRRQVCILSDLPQGNIFLPLELIDDGLFSDPAS